MYHCNPYQRFKPVWWLKLSGELFKQALSGISQKNLEFGLGNVHVWLYDSQCESHDQDGMRISDLDDSLKIPGHPGLDLDAVKDFHRPHCSWLVPRITGFRGKKRTCRLFLFSGEGGRGDREECSPVISSYWLLKCCKEKITLAIS